MKHPTAHDGLRGNHKKAWRPDSSSIQTLRAYEAVFNSFRFYTEMSCYVVPTDDPEEWICLQSDLKHFHIKEFEALFGKNEERHRYNLDNFARLSREKKTIGSVFSGFHNLFVPVMKSGNCVAYLTSGIFLKKLPSRQDLESQWESWSGRKPFLGDVDFRRFVSAALNTPLLDGPQAAAHLELMKMVALLVAGEGNPEKIAARATRLNHRIFTRWKLDVRWPWRALGLEAGGEKRVWPNRRLDELDLIASKLKRVPRVAIALLLEDPQDRRLNEVDILIRQKNLERAGFLFAQKLEETVSFPLQDEGLVFLTSSRPGASPTQSKLQLRETARAIAEKMGALFGVQARAGIGSAVPEGDGLFPSSREAFQALQWAVDRNRKVLFYDEIGKPGSQPTATEPAWPEPHRLMETFRKGLKAEESAAVDGYFRDVFWHSAGRPDLIRVHLMDTLSHYAAALEKELLLPSGRFAGLLRDFSSRFEKTRSSKEIRNGFKEAMDSLREFSFRPAIAGGKSAVMELKSYVAEHFRSPLSVNGAARKMGVSRSTFHRHVLQWLGMGFQEYVQKTRLEESKVMLRGSRYSVARIAKECGFTGSGYFIRVFKKAAGMTPNEYRTHPAD